MMPEHGSHGDDNGQPGGAYGRVAVVLFNLGGPDKPESVQPFLFNLFNDPAIIDLPWILRTPLAHFVSRRRAPTAREIYDHMGGRSPIVPETEAQAEALKTALMETGQFEAVDVSIAMRYWHPRAEVAAAQVKAFAPDRIVLLPLYPQFSATTSGSSLKEWHEAAAQAGVRAPTHTLCCSPTEPSLIEAHAALLTKALQEVGEQPVRVLFSAHGLPKRNVAKGDPYQWQVEQTCAAIVDKLGMAGLDWITCYQSRVGPLEWIGPSTDDEIERAGADGKAVVLSPIAFVSEHSETLVELDIEYRELAEHAQVPAYVRVPALGAHPGYVQSLVNGLFTALENGSMCSHTGGRVCPAVHKRCPMRLSARTDQGMSAQRAAR